MTDREICETSSTLGDSFPAKPNAFMPWTRVVLLMLKAVRMGELHLQMPCAGICCSEAIFVSAKIIWMAPGIRLI